MTVEDFNLNLETGSSIAFIYELISRHYCIIMEYFPIHVKLYSQYFITFYCTIAYHVNVLSSKPVLPYNFICGQIEDIQHVRAGLYCRVFNAYSASIQYPKSVANVYVYSVTIELTMGHLLPTEKETNLSIIGYCSGTK